MPSSLCPGGQKRTAGLWDRPGPRLLSTYHMYAWCWVLGYKSKTEIASKLRGGKLQSRSSCMKCLRSHRPGIGSMGKELSEM
ncbi:hypothetical protein R6Z07M_015444 [Ovis aries]